MKSAAEKTEFLIEHLVGIDMRTSIGIDKARKLIRIAIKEQGRDTRHACANAVNMLGAAHSGDDDLIERNSAHTACMNVTAI